MKILGIAYIAGLTVALVATGSPWWAIAVLSSGLYLVKKNKL